MMEAQQAEDQSGLADSFLGRAHDEPLPIGHFQLENNIGMERSSSIGGYLLNVQDMSSENSAALCSCSHDRPRRPRLDPTSEVVFPDLGHVNSSNVSLNQTPYDYSWSLPPYIIPRSACSQYCLRYSYDSLADPTQGTWVATAGAGDLHQQVSATLPDGGGLKQATGE